MVTQALGRPNYVQTYDSIEITGGAVFYQSGDLRRTESIGSNDREYLEIK